MSGKIDAFRRWVQRCEPNGVFVYHRSTQGDRDVELFSHARKLSEAGLAFLFQRRIPDGWEYCARRSRPKDHNVLDRVSASIKVSQPQQEAA